MRIFLDTNVFLDMLITRDNVEDNRNALKLLALSVNKKLTFCVSPISLATAFYLMRKDPDAVKKIEQRLKTLTIIPVGEEQVRFSLSFDFFPDKEDSMLISSAYSNDCEAILTRDGSHFTNSPLPVYTPQEFLSRLS